MRIDGVGALVVGGASGLGAATALELAEFGAVVTIADLNAEAGEALAAKLGGRFVACDVRDPAAVEAAVVAAGEVHELRIAVSCAGIGIGYKLATRDGPHPPEVFRAVLETNLFGTFNVMSLSAHAMLQLEPTESGERGVIVTTASVAAFEGQVGQLAYSASKGAIVSMTLTGARDLARDGIRVVSIAPGVFDTPLLGMLPEEARASLAGGVPFPSRLGDPAEYGSLVRAVVENPYLNGTTIRLDGALRMPPR